ncbi:branched-chain amino acid transport system permease protein [Rhizobium binae]|uniref:Branched-chain amino acid transport system permease protein n=1 Tax=Rhizobium binae TaxID=1138190 RepID=A0ABV2MAZ7_9HYPH|nr:branched-chain amino acid ABC transporter permease [Rhizobium binae]MBX4989947.1 branched-chain amino acid ABC transporter permease [Rhizobium binae]NKL48388.1 branched-chain amino acid ABC transporter permease [Rhizobium leguminosarum bv. viciae]QSY82960.1 branched-chain amino acid ABC transporter permease [Rhizobium binae]
MTKKIDNAYITLLVIALALCLMPIVLPKAGLALATEFCVVLTIALAWNLLGGFSGIVLIGMPLFIGIGGYTLYIVANFLAVPPYPVIAICAAVSAILAYVLSPLLFRLQGAQLAIGSWVMAEIARLLCLVTPAVGAGGGLNLEVMKSVARNWRLPLNFASAALVLFITLLAIVVLLKSRFGLGLRAMRDSDAAAEAMGVRTNRVRLYTLVLAAGISGAAGACYYITSIQITPNSAFSQNWIAMTIFIVILGGIGSVEGPIFGAIVYFLLRETLSGLGPGYFVISGLLAIVVTIFLPEGVWGLVRRVIRIDLLPVAHQPSAEPPALPSAHLQTQEILS